jgi:hypothetical protein
VGILLLVAAAGCGDQSTPTVVRGADDVEVMAPSEVALLRASVSTTLVPLTVDVGTATDGSPPTTAAPGAVPASAAATDTVPLNEDDRPAELRLFDAFTKFRSCIEDEGYTIQGDLADRNNPAYQDSAYLAVIQTCAARSDIVNVLNEVQATRSSLTPDEVETRNESFKVLQACLEPKGWTIETATNEIGLIEPSKFVGPDGTLDERDINQCLSETGILDAAEEQSGA